MVITHSLLWAEWRHNLRPDDLEKIILILKGGFHALDARPPADKILYINACDLMDMGHTPDDVLGAVRALRLAPVPAHMHRRPPLSGDIHNYLCPEVPLEDRADEGMQKVIGSISRFGYVNAEGAREALGETIWQVIQRSGGWTNLCCTLTDQVATLRAQLKRSLVAAYRAEDQAVSRARLVGRETRQHLEIARERFTPALGASEMSPTGEGLDDILGSLKKTMSMQ